MSVKWSPLLTADSAVMRFSFDMFLGEDTLHPSSLSMQAITYKKTSNLLGILLDQAYGQGKGQSPGQMVD